MTSRRRAPCRIADTTVAPGSWERIDVPVARLPTGTWLHLPIAVAHGPKRGAPRLAERGDPRRRAQRHRDHPAGAAARPSRGAHGNPRRRAHRERVRVAATDPVPAGPSGSQPVVSRLRYGFARRASRALPHADTSSRAVTWGSTCTRGPRAGATSRRSARTSATPRRCAWRGRSTPPPSCTPVPATVPCERRRRAPGCRCCCSRAARRSASTRK